MENALPTPPPKKKSVIVGLARHQVAISSQEIAGELSASEAGKPCRGSMRTAGENPWENGKIHGTIHEKS